MFLHKTLKDKHTASYLTDKHTLNHETRPDRNELMLVRKSVYSWSDTWLIYLCSKHFYCRWLWHYIHSTTIIQRCKDWTWSQGDCQGLLVCRGQYLHSERQLWTDVPHSRAHCGQTGRHLRAHRERVRDVMHVLDDHSILKRGSQVTVLARLRRLNVLGIHTMYNNLQSLHHGRFLPPCRLLLWFGTFSYSPGGCLW